MTPWPRIRAALVAALMGAVGAGMLLLVLDVLWGVASRYAFGRPSPWSEELATALLLWVSLFGSALAYAQHAHLGIDWFVLRLHPDGRRILAVTVQAVVLVLTAVVLVYGGWVLTAETLASGQTSPSLGVRAGWKYLPVPLSGLCIVVFAAEQLLQAARGGQGAPA